MATPDEVETRLKNAEANVTVLTQRANENDKRAEADRSTVDALRKQWNGTAGLIKEWKDNPPWKELLPAPKETTFAEALKIVLGGVGTSAGNVMKAIAKPAMFVVLGAALFFGGMKSGCVKPNPDPVPPNPNPVDPNPPKPLPPNPNPAPIPLPGFRVLMMYDKDALTPEQQGVVFGAVVRKYLDTKCVIGEDGKTPDRRIYAAGQTVNGVFVPIDVSGEAQWIRDVVQRHPGQKSWMVVSDGKTGYDGELPKNADEAMKILQKIGG